MGITKDAEKIICYIYKIYLTRRKSGQSRAESRDFDEDFYKSDRELSEWCESDIEDCLVELAQHGYIKLYIGGDFVLLEPTIVYMENKFKKGLVEVTDFIAKFF